MQLIAEEASEGGAKILKLDTPVTEVEGGTEASDRAEISSCWKEDNIMVWGNEERSVMGVESAELKAAR